MKLRQSEREINGASLAINALKCMCKRTHTDREREREGERNDLLICLCQLSKLYWHLCIPFKWLR